MFENDSTIQLHAANNSNSRMMEATLSVRELTVDDIDHIIDYWHNADEAYLESMGAEKEKMPSRNAFKEMLTTQLETPLEQRRSYCLLWIIDGEPVGHCNTNPTHHGKEAFMHLHLWRSHLRQRGLGVRFLKPSIHLFFERLKLERLYCEPYALNPAPNKTFEKLGFTLEKEYITIPGAMNFEQPVKRWTLTKEQEQKWYEGNSNCT